MPLVPAAAGTVHGLEVPPAWLPDNWRVIGGSWNRSLAAATDAVARRSTLSR